MMVFMAHSRVFSVWGGRGESGGRSDFKELSFCGPCFPIIIYLIAI